MGIGTGRQHELNAPICYIEPFQKAFNDETRVSTLFRHSLMLAGSLLYAKHTAPCRL